MAYKVARWFQWKDVTGNPGEPLPEGKLPPEVIEELKRQKRLEETPDEPPAPPRAEAPPRPEEE